MAVSEGWLNTKWRPAMGWMYMTVCVFDFILFPIAWSILQAVQGGEVRQQWEPITLVGAGLFHMAMGAVLGITAWSRGQEKMRGTLYAEEYSNEYQDCERDKYNTRSRSNRKSPPHRRDDVI